MEEGKERDEGSNTLESPTGSKRSTRRACTKELEPPTISGSFLLETMSEMTEPARFRKSRGEKSSWRTGSTSPRR